LFFLIEFRQNSAVASTRSFRLLSLANAIVACCLTIVYMVRIDTQATGVGNPSSRTRCLVTLLFVAMLIVLRKWDDTLAKNRILRPLMWVGAFSYGLYLTHNIVIPYVDILSRRVGLNGSTYWIAFCLQIAVAIAFGRIFYRLVERRFISKQQIERLAVEHVA
jgi:peptidoglycan/LPS O-acetylase OafA/YrhL